MRLCVALYHQAVAMGGDTARVRLKRGTRQEGVKKEDNRREEPKPKRTSARGPTLTRGTPRVACPTSLLAAVEGRDTDMAGVAKREPKIDADASDRAGAPLAARLLPCASCPCDLPDLRATARLM